MSKDLRRKLRANSTAAERGFWRLIFPLRTGGYHFRKQVQLGPYYVDFACLHAGLAIEIDGATHDANTTQTNDRTRDEYLRSRGFRVLRFTNDDVLFNPEGVYHMLCEALRDRAMNLRASPPPQPSPQGGGCRPGDAHETLPHVALAGPVEAGEGKP